MNNKAHLRPKDFDSNGDIIPMSMKEEKGDIISREALKETIDGITWYHINSHGELTEGAFDDDDAFYKAEDIYNAIDNAPTVEYPFYQEAYQTGYEEGKNEILKGKCENCDLYFKAMTKKESEIIKAYTKGFDTGVETVKDERPQGEWIDHSEEGYVECPICNCLTNCEDNIDELHYCWNCGAKLKKGGADMRLES